MKMGKEVDLEDLLNMGGKEWGHEEVQPCQGVKEEVAMLYPQVLCGVVRELNTTQQSLAEDNFQLLEKDSYR